MIVVAFPSSGDVSNLEEIEVKIEESKRGGF